MVSFMAASSRSLWRFDDPREACERRPEPPPQRPGRAHAERWGTIAQTAGVVHLWAGGKAVSRQLSALSQWRGATRLFVSLNADSSLTSPASAGAARYPRPGFGRWRAA